MKAATNESNLQQALHTQQQLLSLLRQCNAAFQEVERQLAAAQQPDFDPNELSDLLDQVTQVEAERRQQLEAIMATHHTQTTHFTVQHRQLLDEGESIIQQLQDIPERIQRLLRSINDRKVLAGKGARALNAYGRAAKSFQR